MAKKPTLTQSLNHDLHKFEAEIYKKATKDIIRSIINKVPRELLIEELVRKKIIMKDWLQKGNKYVLRENGKN